MEVEHLVRKKQVANAITLVVKELAMMNILQCRHRERLELGVRRDGKAEGAREGNSGDNRMTVCGVEITESRMTWILAVKCHVELQLGRRLTEGELDQVLMAAVRHLAEPPAPTTTLQ